MITVEPLNKGHFGTSHFVLCKEAVLCSEVKNVLLQWEGCTEGGCPFLGESFIGGSTVPLSLNLPYHHAYTSPCAVISRYVSVNSTGSMRSTALVLTQTSALPTSSYTLTLSSAKPTTNSMIV